MTPRSFSFVTLFSEQLFFCNFSLSFVFREMASVRVDYDITSGKNKMICILVSMRSIQSGYLQNGRGARQRP